MLASFRHQTDAEPSKLWEITNSCSVTEASVAAASAEQCPAAWIWTVSAVALCSRLAAGCACCLRGLLARDLNLLGLQPQQVERGTFHLRVDTSTLVAVIAAKFTDVEMVRRAQEWAVTGVAFCGPCARSLTGDCRLRACERAARAAGIRPARQLEAATADLAGLLPPPPRSTPSCCTLASAASLLRSRSASASRQKSRWGPTLQLTESRAAVHGAAGCTGSMWSAASALLIVRGCPARAGVAQPAAGSLQLTTRHRHCTALCACRRSSGAASCQP